jgi:hypothetical protein
MDFSSINWLAVLVCVLAAMVIGSVWFNPKTFFPAWWQAIGKSGEPGMGGNMGLTWGLTVLAALVQSIFMSLMVTAMGSLAGGASLVSGMTTGFLLWLGFVVPSSLTNKIFSAQFKAWFIEVGNHLVTFVVMGAILGAWR